MLEFLPRFLELIAIVWLVRFLLSNLMGSGTRTPTSGQFWSGGPSRTASQPRSEPQVISGEMKKDPQCGTYVSTELSLKSRLGSEILHFCSRECQDEFLKARSSKPA